MAHDIQPQNVAVLPGIDLQLSHSPMGAFIHPIGITVRMKLGFKQRLNNVAQGVVHDPISERGSADFSPFWLMNGEMLICTWLICAIFQLCL